MSRILAVPLLFLTVLFAGCSKTFDIKVNDRVVYTPKPLFEDYDIPDEALATCVQAAIASQRATSASGLRELNCSQAGITSVEGLGVFTALDRLDLSGNQIEDIGPLAAITAVQVLLLNDNDIVSAQPLYRMQALIELNLRGNGQLRCPDRGALFSVERMRLPRHCGS